MPHNALVNLDIHEEIGKAWTPPSVFYTSAEAYDEALEKVWMASDRTGDPRAQPGAGLHGPRALKGTCSSRSRNGAIGSILEDPG